MLCQVGRSASAELCGGSPGLEEGVRGVRDRNRAGGCAGWGGGTALTGVEDWYRRMDGAGLSEATCLLSAAARLHMGIPHQGGRGGQRASPDTGRFGLGQF